ncbi:MAG TPA: aldo/keto reductase [Kiritimatiellia bacterium]|nr:aldo/keto reductase [Kiritimatiellia bacterium]
MRTRLLGQTGLQVSEIGIGAWQLGGPLVLDGKADGHPDLGAEFVIDLIRRVGELGVNFIDTAEQYGAGESERRVGRAISGQRSRWIVSTKWGAWQGPNGERANDASVARLPHSLEGSLRRLDTDYIDVYLYHVPPADGEAERAAEHLLRLKQEGKVRAVGISTNDLALCKRLHALGILDVVQYAHSMINVPRELLAWQRENGVGGIVRGAFAGGRLSGRYFRAPPRFSPDDIRAKWFPDDEAARAAEFARYAVFEQWVSPARTMSQLALRYLLDEPTTHTIILGAKSIADYERAIAAATLPPLAEIERAGIEAAVAAL